MIISGLVIHLSQVEQLRISALQAMVGFETLELGQQQFARLPAVLETADQRDAESKVSQLGEIPGVEHVDIAYVHFLEDECLESEPLR